MTGIDGKITPKGPGDFEPFDDGMDEVLEAWVKTHAAGLASDFVLLGRQVPGMKLDWESVCGNDCAAEAAALAHAVVRGCGNSAREEYRRLVAAMLDAVTVRIGDEPDGPYWAWRKQQEQDYDPE